MSEKYLDIKAFIKKHPLAVLSTADKNGKCWGAVIFIHCEDVPDQLKLYFMTRNEALKYKNLQENNSLCLTFSHEQSTATLQISGSSSEVENLERRMHILGHLSAIANERIETWAPVFQLSDGTVRLMEVIPEYARLSEFNEGKPYITEASFN